MVEELFQGGVCGGTWWNPNLFSGGGGGLLSPCSAAQLGGGGGGCYDMGGCGFGWSHEIIKSRFNNNNNNNNNNQVSCDDNNSNNNNNNININNLVFSADFETTFDVLDFGITPTTSTIDWNQQQNQFFKGGNNEENYESLLHDNLINSIKFLNQDNNNSPPTTITTSSNNTSPKNSSTITYEDDLTTSYPVNSSASYLIQTLFDDVDNEPQVSIPQLINPNNDFGPMDSQLWGKLSDDNSISLVQSPTSQSVQKFDGVNMLSNVGQVSNGGGYNTVTNLSDIRATFNNSKPHDCANLTTKKLKNEETRHVSRKNTNNNEPEAKRPRIETPSSLPTFKVRKEKLGDRITALQQLVSPFGKTDTASVLHEAIEYIKFLHDQVHVLSTPYLKNGTIVQRQQVSNNKVEHDKQDLRTRGLCLVPISSTYPVTHETPVDFWTPTFGGTTFR